PGVGPKGAVDLLTTYGTLENLYKNAENISKKGLREKILAGKESAMLSKKLVQLHCELDLPLKLEDLACPGINEDALKEMLLEYELKSLVKLVAAANCGPGESPVETPAEEEPVARVAAAYTLVNTMDGLKAMVADLSRHKTLAVDTETTSLDNKIAKLV